MTDTQTLYALLRSDLSSFIHRTFQTVTPGTPYLHNWHIDAMAHVLERCYQGEIRRLIITLPPRSLKSIAVSVAYVASVLGRDPTRNIICVSYAQDLATKHAIDTRAVIEADWYRKAFPGTRIDPGKNTQSEIATTKRGGRLAVSVGGSLTGRGGSLLIIDDPHKAEEGNSEVKLAAAWDWYRTTLASRLDNKQADTIILIQQRLHENDLAGHLLETGEWHHLNLPAIAEHAETVPTGPNSNHIRAPGDVLHAEREPLAVLNATKEELGSYAFAAQYQQQPAPMGGGVIKWEWFKRYDVAPEKEGSDRIVQSWDTASKAETMHDYSVCTTWLVKNHDLYLLHVSRARLEMPDLKRKVVQMAEHWQADSVLIEDKGAGTQLIQDLRRESSLRIVEIVPKDDKVTRVLGITSIIEGGRVWIPTEAHWLADFHNELIRFPRAKHDDQVDSVSQLLHWTRKRRGPGNWDASAVIVAPSLMDDYLSGTGPDLPTPQQVIDEGWY